MSSSDLSVICGILLGSGQVAGCVAKPCGNGELLDGHAVRSRGKRQLKRAMVAAREWW